MCALTFRLSTGSFLDSAFFFLPGPIFSILQLVGLFAVPAKVHLAIQEVRNILYSNPRIWHPFDERTYQIASVFVNHVEQANIGISVWGFTIVTKPLILTVC
uniref:Uncharacterized protein n=1 Tax=Acrobeloides nanus TaxID=290746 RepID=A0A914E7Q3_9BILA